MWLWTCLALGVLLPGRGESSPSPSPPCEYSEGELIRYQCPTLELKAREDGLAEVDCQGNILNCSSVPSVDIGHGRVLTRMEVTRCGMPHIQEGGALACVVGRLGGSGARTLLTTELSAPLTKYDVEGLDMMEKLIMFSAHAQTEIPTEAISILPSLVELRIVEGGAPPLGGGVFPPSPLRYLEVSLSGVEGLPGGSFRHLGKLEILNLWGNNIQNISVDAFEGLSSLKTLSLEKNLIVELPRGVFNNTPRLRTLTLTSNPLTRVPRGVFTQLAYLEQLSLQSTATLSLSPLSLSSLPSLLSLSLADSNISVIPGNLLEGSTNLINISLANNQIQYIPHELFKGMLSVERLDLSSNKLSNISSDMFVDLIKVTDINLDYNYIEHIPEHVFSSCSHLSSLSLSHNIITSIAFSSLPSSLSSLLLRHNLLTYSPDPPPPPGSPGSDGIDLYFDFGQQSPFNSLANLKVLDLSYNNISIVFTDWRLVLVHNLENLNLSHNGFTELTAADVQFLSTKVVVDLTYNNITNIDLSDSYFPPSSPTSSPTILLDHNPFTCDCYLYSFLSQFNRSSLFNIENAQCASPPYLKDMKLTSLPPGKLTCPLPDSPPTCTCNFRPSTSRVECKCNDISQLPDPSQHGVQELNLKLTRPVSLENLPPYVKEVNMSNLGLTEIGLVPKTVELLDLSQNRLEEIPLALLNSNTSLYLGGNPFKCDCSHTSAIKRLIRFISHVNDRNAVRCITGGAVSAVAADKLCDVTRAVTLGTSLALFGIIIAVIGALSWRYSVEIRLYLATWPGLGWLLDKEADGDKKWDVFVSFSHRDFPFVRDVLLPSLDVDYRVLVHYREWEVGEPIPAQIHRSVAQSRRTLLVLSKNFVESTWALEEFRAACAASARDNTTRAVVLMLEKIQLEKLPEELRQYLSITTYLEWGDPKFWEKLRRALPRKSPSSPPPTPPTPPTGEVVKSALDVVLDDNKQLVNRAYVKDV